MTSIIYFQNWDDENHGWKSTTSMAENPSTPSRILVNHPLAKYAIMFIGNGGWAIKANKPPVTEGSIKIRFRSMPTAFSRNILSLNVRDKKGAQLFKYGYGGGGLIIANKQPLSDGTLGPINTLIKYKAGHIYDIIATHEIGSGEFTLQICLLYTSPSPRDRTRSRMPSSA